MLTHHDGIAVVVVTEVVALVHVETEPRIEAIEMRNGPDTQGRGRGRDFEKNRSLSGHLGLSLAVDLSLSLAPVPQIKEIKEKNRRGDTHCLRAAVIPMMEENDGSETRRTSGKKVESGGKRKKREKKEKRDKVYLSTTLV